MNNCNLKEVQNLYNSLVGLHYEINNIIDNVLPSLDIEVALTNDNLLKLIRLLHKFNKLETELLIPPLMRDDITECCKECNPEND